MTALNHPKRKGPTKSKGGLGKHGGADPSSDAGLGDLEFRDTDWIKNASQQLSILIPKVLASAIKHVDPRVRIAAAHAATSLLDACQAPYPTPNPYPNPNPNSN